MLSRAVNLWPAGRWSTPSKHDYVNGQNIVSWQKAVDRHKKNGVNKQVSLRDIVRFPAGYGEPQYDWEPPRIASGVKSRVARLKALGNAVVPAQVLPILAAIAAIEQNNRLGG